MQQNEKRNSKAKPKMITDVSFNLIYKIILILHKTFDYTKNKIKCFKI
jgi:hypothetical protein